MNGKFLSIMGWQSLAFSIVLTGTVFAQSAGGAKKTFALLNLSANGVSVDVVSMLVNELRTELEAIGTYTFSDFNSIQKQLKELYEDDLISCNKSTCAVKAGQLLGVNFVAIGGIGLINETYSINIRVIEVNTGRVKIDVNEYFTGKEKDLEQKLIPVIAAKVSGVKASKRKSKRGPLFKAIVIGSGVAVGIPIVILIIKGISNKEDPQQTTEVKVQWN